MKIGFVGSGNMAAAMARGWASAMAAGADGAPSELAATDAGSGRAQRLMGELGGRAIEGLDALATEADVIVLAMKPGGLDAVAAEIGPGDAAILSVLGATPLEKLTAAFPDRDVIRAMPNVGTEARRGVLAYAVPEGADPDQTARIAALLGSIGLAVPLPDNLIDAATAISGCAPAYLALIAESLIDAGVREGLPAAAAREMVAETIAGTAELLGERDTLEIRRSVTSPGGSTAAGLEALERGAVRAALGEAVKASLERMRG